MRDANFFVALGCIAMSTVSVGLGKESIAAWYMQLAIMNMLIQIYFELKKK